MFDPKGATAVFSRLVRNNKELNQTTDSLIFHRIGCNQLVTKDDDHDSQSHNKGEIKTNDETDTNGRCHAVLKILLDHARSERRRQPASLLVPLYFQQSVTNRQLAIGDGLQSSFFWQPDDIADDFALYLMIFNGRNLSRI